MLSLFISPAAAQDVSDENLGAPPDGHAPVVHEPGAPPEVLNTEVGHAGDEGHGGTFPPFDFSTFPSQLLWLAITFGALYYVMSKVLVPKLSGIVEGRQSRIQGDLAEAERLRAETDAAVAAYEQALAEARKNANAIAQSSRETVAAEIAGKRKTAETSLSGKLAEADARIAEVKARALADVDAVATEATEAVVQLLIGETSHEEAAAAVAAERRG